MSSSKAPKTPDYTSAAIAQGQSDKEIAQYLTQANRVNQVDPYGQTTWTQATAPGTEDAKKDLDYWTNFVSGAPISDNRQRRPEDVAWAQSHQLADATSKYNTLKGNGQWTQTTTLTPEQQKLLGQQQSIQSLQNDRITGLIRDTANPTAPTLGPQRQLKEANQNNIQSLLYDQITKQYGDRFAQEEAAQRAQLANQGFQQGSEGFNTALTNFTRGKNEAYGNAATQAALSSYDQYNKERGINQAEYGTLSANDLNRFNALQGQYATDKGYLAQLLGGVQGPTPPQYQPYAQATPYQSPDLLGAMQGQYQGNLNRTNASNASSSQNMQTVGTLAAAAAVAF